MRSSDQSARLRSTGRMRCSQAPTVAPSTGPSSSLVETCKLNDVDPLAYMTDAFTRIVNGHPNSNIDELLPWPYCRYDLKAVA